RERGRDADVFPARRGLLLDGAADVPGPRLRRDALEEEQQSLEEPLLRRRTARRVVRGGATVPLYRFDLRGAEHRLSWSARTRNLHSQTETDRSGDGLVLDMSTAERLCNGADLIMDVTASVAPSLSGDNVGFACSGWVRTQPYPSNRKKVCVDDLVVQIAEKKTMEFIYEIVLDHATNMDPLLHNVVRMFQGCSDKSFLLTNPAMTLQAALDDVRLTAWPYDEEPLDLNVPEVIAFATRKMDVSRSWLLLSRSTLPPR
ncbi:hypothetical protein MRX96_053098, partial [Rhipicephalus microplus]